jgi:hypothetical protein
LFLQG